MALINLEIMKTLLFFVCSVCCVMIFPTQTQAQSYSIDWFTIDGGGGTSTNGQYSLSGGNFSVDGGFWAFAAVVQTPGAPLLTTTVTGPNTVVVSWPAPSTGFVLQTNSNLATTNWGNFSGTIFDIGANRNVTNKPLTGNLYFRLKHP